MLPVQHKRSRDPGDSKAMVQARRDFLNAGFYQPLADALNQAVLAYAGDAFSPTCLDAGCGEGYYLRQLASAAKATQRSIALLGLDVSKWAVLSAAKQDSSSQQAAWVVGTNAKVPVSDASFDHVLCLFGFPVFKEFLRVLKPGGRLWLMDVGAQHLHQLKAIIYPDIKSDSTSSMTVPDGWQQISSERIQFDVALNSAEDIANLLAMTPHQHRASHEGKAALATRTELSLTADVWLHELQKA